MELETWKIFPHKLYLAWGSERRRKTLNMKVTGVNVQTEGEESLTETNLRKTSHRSERQTQCSSAKHGVNAYANQKHLDGIPGISKLILPLLHDISEHAYMLSTEHCPSDLAIFGTSSLSRNKIQGESAIIWNWRRNYSRPKASLSSYSLTNLSCIPFQWAISWVYRRERQSRYYECFVFPALSCPRVQERSGIQFYNV